MRGAGSPQRTRIAVTVDRLALSLTYTPNGVAAQQLAARTTGAGPSGNRRACHSWSECTSSRHRLLRRASRSISAGGTMRSTMRVTSRGSAANVPSPSEAEPACASSGCAMWRGEHQRARQHNITQHDNDNDNDNMSQHTDAADDAAAGAPASTALAAQRKPTLSSVVTLRSALMASTA